MRSRVDDDDAVLTPSRFYCINFITIVTAPL